jgi:hypothetical protein
MRGSERNEHAGIPYWGVDRAPDARPGVPKERLPPQPLPRSHWVTPERQIPRFEVLKRSDLPELTPVFGTAPPPHGISGAIRRIAYRIPEYKPGHWMLLLAADRVDAVESDPLRLVRRALPFVALALAAGLIVALVRRLLHV